jgi:hypothetical protein
MPVFKSYSLNRHTLASPRSPTEGLKHRTLPVPGASGLAQRAAAGWLWLGPGIWQGQEHSWPLHQLQRASLHPDPQRTAYCNS